jgi:hypothetical protein
MLANAQKEKMNLLNAAIAWLQARLPATWTVERAPATDTGRPDGLITLRAPHGTYTTIAVETKQTVAPRDVKAMTSGLVRSLRQVSGHVPVMVVAPWLSERTRDVLIAEQLNYLDLTGNALIRLDNPALYLSSDGAARNPAPRARAAASLRGTKAARLIRLLADVRPPYGVGELATAAALTPGYVSRLLDSLDRDAIVERGPRGVVTDVNIGALLRAWAGSYDVFRPEVVTQWIAPSGARTAAADLAKVDSRFAITGSFAAVEWAPVAAPTQLVAYCEDIGGVSGDLGLLLADEAPNVVLLKPFDDVVWTRTTRPKDVTYAAPSQVVVDCLTGTGRMPAEGEALLASMLENDAWRAASLPRPKSS